METGWRHDDHQSQKEFERIQPKKASAEAQGQESISFEPTPARRGQPTAEVIIRSPQSTIDISRRQRSGRVYWDIERFLTVMHEGVPVPHNMVTGQYNNVQVIDFRGNVDVYKGEDNHIIVEVIGGAGGGMSSWWLNTPSDGSTEITDGETVVFTGSGSATVTRTGNTINVDVPASSYSWDVRADSLLTTGTVDNTEIVQFLGANGVTTELITAGDHYVTIRRPLVLYRTTDTDTINVTSDNGITDIYFENDVATKPAGYTKRVWLDVTNPVAGRAKIEAWYEDLTGGGSYDWTVAGDSGSEVVTTGSTITFAGGTNITTAYDAGTNTLTINNTYSYSWDLQANGGTSTTIVNGGTVNFTGTGAATVSRSGNTITIDVPLGGYSWTASDGTSSSSIASGNTVTWLGGTNTTVTYDSGTRTFTINNTYSYDWNVQGDTGGPSTLASGAILDIAGGTDITTALTGAGPFTLTVNSTYVWQLDHNTSGSPANVTSGTVVNLIEGTNVSITRTSTDVTINNTYSYDWDIQADTGGPSTLTSGAVLDIAGGTGVDTVLTGVGPFTVTVNRPLTIEDDNVAVGGGDTLFLNFDSQTETTTAQAVNFVVTDDGTGQRSVKAYVPASGGSYSWTVIGDSGSYVVPNSGSVTITGSNGVTTSVSGSTVTIDRPLTGTQTHDTDVNDFTSGSAITTIQHENAVSAKPAGWTKRVWFDVTEPVAGRLKIEGWYEDLGSGGSYDWTVAGDSGSEIVASGETITWAGGTNITTSYDSGTNTLTINCTYTYTWNIGDGSTNTAVGNGGTVNIVGRNGIITTRSGTDIIVEIDPTDPPGGGNEPKRTLVGELEIATGLTDIYGGVPGYYYGIRRYVDIVHNWNLPNMNNFHLELTDIQLNDLGTLSHTRNADTYPAGLWSGAAQKSRFVNRPHWAAIDRDTIRVYTTMTEEDTSMKFRYVLTEE